MLDFFLGDMADAIRDTTQRFAADRISPLAARIDAEDWFPREELWMATLKRSLVNGVQRLELTGWTAARLDWYKAQGCFTEIIRYQTRLFVPTDQANAILARLAR